MKGQHESIREVFIKWKEDNQVYIRTTGYLIVFSDMALYTFQLNGFEKLCKKFCDGDFCIFAQILGQKVPTHILPTTTRIGLIALARLVKPYLHRLDWLYCSGAIHFGSTYFLSI